MAPRLTADDKQYILKRYQEGAPLRTIGREIGRPDMAVRRVLIAAGIDLGPARTSNKRSSPETEALVLSLYDQGIAWKEINEQAGVTSTTVAKILERNGRSLDRKPESARAKALAIVTLHESGHSARAIGRELGHSKSTIRAILAGDGYAPTSPGCEYPDFFEKMDTAEKAYWLGFISADGCIITTPRHPEGAQLALKLAIRDKGHLLKLKQALGASTGVHTGMQGDRKQHGFASFAVSSQRLVKSLRALDVTPRKSATLKPWKGPDHLMPHYWRGMIDGDGSIAIKGNGQHTLFLCGSELTVRAFAEWAAEICGTAAQPYPNTGCWYLSVSGRHQVPALVRALYGTGAVSLDRKQERAERVLACEQPRRKPGPPRMEFASEEERIKYFRAQKAASQRRYMERKRQAEVPEP